jgi:membrane-bound metal-dependent hydrolase YbcI (DUF457 family)
MPFTPFHLGAAALLKPVLRTRFSFLVFGISQIAIDIEPLVRMLRRDPLLHGWSHTLTGAFLLGALAALVAKRPVNWWLAHLSRGAPPNALLVPVTWRVALFSAWIGTASHLVLDGIMHHDMRPFVPISTANPLLGLVSLGVLHIGLLAAGLLGLILMAVREKRSGAGE